MSVPTTGAGTYYVLAYNRSATAGYTITATAAGFSVSGVSPNAGGNTGKVTVAITGARLTPTTQFRLDNGGTTVNATAVDFRDASLAYATFDLTGRPTGAYTVRVRGGGATTSEASVSVVPGIRSARWLVTTNAIWPWVSTAALERPVVPEVKKNQQGSS